MAQQSEIFARYRSLQNSNNSKPIDNEKNRSLNNMDFIDFLVELIKSTKGKQDFKNIILKGTLSKVKDMDGINNIIKQSLSSQFTCDQSLTIPTKYTTKSNLGIILPKSSIDPFGLFGFDPEDKSGSYMFEGNDIQKHINYFIYKAQDSTPSAPAEFKYNNNVLFTISLIDANNFEFKFGEYYENKFFSVWFTDYIAASSPVFNFVNFTAVLADILTGAVSIKGNKNLVEIKELSRYNKVLKKIFGFCSLEDEDDPNIYNPNNANNQIFGFGATSNSETENFNPFILSTTELDEIDRVANNRYNNVMLFETCGNLELPINPDTIINDLGLLFSSANINEFYSYDDGNQVLTNETNNSSIYDNGLSDINLDQTINFFDKAIRDGANTLISAGEDINLNLPNINAELQLNILKSIPYAALQIVLTPKIMMLPILFCNLQGGENCNKSADEYFKNMLPTIKNSGIKISLIIIENIFNSIVSDIKKIGKNIILNFLKQRGVDYLATLQSLFNLLKLIPNNFKNDCDGYLNKLLALLKFANFGPMPMIPPPLILVAGALKPGMNSVAIINDVKSRLTQKGIETAPVLPDGSPNNLMIAIEETIKSLVTSIKTDSNVQVFGISAVGPVQGYAQIQ